MSNVVDIGGLVFVLFEFINLKFVERVFIKVVEVIKKDIVILEVWEKVFIKFKRYCIIGVVGFCQ